MVNTFVEIDDPQFEDHINNLAALIVPFLQEQMPHACAAEHANVVANTCGHVIGTLYANSKASHEIQTGKEYPYDISEDAIGYGRIAATAAVQAMDQLPRIKELMLEAVAQGATKQ